MPVAPRSLRPLVVAALLFAGCSGDEPAKDADAAGDTGATDTPPEDSAIDSATDTGGPTRPSFDCFSEVTIEDDDDPDPDGGGYDGWDPENPTWQLYLERDYNGNGIPEQFASWVRDDAGRVLHFEQWGSSPGAYDATYDEDGNRVTYDEDSDGDGLYDVSYRYGFEAGVLVLYERDDDADGDMDYILAYVRGKDGRRLSATEDDDGDGVVDTSYVYTHDDQAREIEITVDEGDDGTVERRVVSVYTDPVLRVGTSTSEDALGTVQQVTGFAYDEAGREVYYGFDIPPIGEAFDYERWFERDPDGAVVNYRLLTSLYGDQLELQQDLEYDGLRRQTRVHTVVRNVTAGTLDDDTVYAYAYGGTCPSP